MKQSASDAWRAVERPGTGPEISLVMPCYNEEAIVAQTIRRTLHAFQVPGYRLELVAVDNGSHDRTGEIIKEFEAAGAGVKHVRVEKNQGYGFGILSGIPHCTAPWIGFIPADSQVDAEDTVRLYEEALACEEAVVVKARRRFRMDGFTRKVVSVTYNMLFRTLWPSIASFDINGLPKLMPREVVRRMQLSSSDWFLDPEIMIKSHYLGVRCIEYNVFARMRSRGLSHVSAATCVNFFSGLIRYRFSNTLSAWRRGLVSSREIAAHEAGAARADS
ncbi:MAG TPA: glycosyltransferase family 2 protein [Burkholderiales bacterium]|nr:glycosyltransferase family 2 protein [Burkholderiales bacterium]